MIIITPKQYRETRYLIKPSQDPQEPSFGSDLQSPITSPLNAPADALTLPPYPLPVGGEAKTISDNDSKNGSDNQDLEPLGSYTKSSSPYRVPITLQTLTRQALRANRYDVQNSIKTIFMGAHGIQKGTLADVDYYNTLPRVCKCNRVRIKPTVDQYQSIKYGSQFFKGVVQCGSIWLCPVCASKVQATRRMEIENAITALECKGYKAVFFTFTLPHYVHQSCDDLLKVQTKMLKSLRSGKAWQDFKKRIGFVGLIRSLEVTYGSNGWHPHTHELFFVDKAADIGEITRYISDRWLRLALKFQLIPKGKIKAFKRHSVSVGFSTSDYLAKFDRDEYSKKLSCEISLSSVKSGRDGSLHPYQLAQLAHGDGRPDKKATSLFLEYAHAFKGKAQIFWSRGLKLLTGIEDLTDEEIVNSLEDRAVIIHSYTAIEWRYVLNKKARAYVLQIGESEGSKAIIDFLYKPPNIEN